MVWEEEKAATPAVDEKSKILLPIAPVPEKSLPKDLEEEDDTDDSRTSSIKKGINAKNPFIKGCPFWTVGTGEEEEMAEDDYPVDIEAIEKVVNGAELKRPPFIKKNFDCNADMDTFKKDDALFEKELIFGNTVTSVLNLFCQDQKESKGESKEKPKRSSEKDLPSAERSEKMVTWANTIMITTFDVERREPKKKRVPQEEPMRDVKRMSGETTKD